MKKYKIKANKLLIMGILVIFMINFISAAQICEVYDNFSSGSLDLDKWEIRQDVEGQPFMDEYEVKEENGELGYHIQQNTIGSGRVYLVPKHNLEIGESFKYEVNLISKEGHYGSVILLVGEEYYRTILSAAGYNNGIQNYDELGISHINVSFSGNEFVAIRKSPSGEFFEKTLSAQNPNGNYELYIGAWSGHNGKVHIDFDNFELCSEQENPENPEPPQDDLEQRVFELEEKMMEMENKTLLLENTTLLLEESLFSLQEFFDNFVGNFEEFLSGLPRGLLN